MLTAAFIYTYVRKYIHTPGVLEPGICIRYLRDIYASIRITSISNHSRRSVQENFFSFIYFIRSKHQSSPLFLPSCIRILIPDPTRSEYVGFYFLIKAGALGPADNPLSPA
jgi:hypothetical protein